MIKIQLNQWPTFKWKPIKHGACVRWGFWSVGFYD